MFRDRAQDALLEAAAPILARIRRDSERARSSALRAFLRYIEENLFRPGLEVGDFWEDTGLRSQRLWKEFHAFADKTPKEYIDTNRLDVAKSMLVSTNLKVWRVGAAVGYADRTTFTRVFRRMNNDQLPSLFRREARKPRCGRALLEAATFGGLDSRSYRDYIREAVATNPGLEAELLEYCRERLPPARIVVDGAGDDRLKAEELWRQIRDLPAVEQRRRVRGVFFKSTVLFDLLREQSRLEGRRDRQRGIDVAELALVSLEQGDEFFGERIHDLRALGWAWLGNAHRLAGDFSAADGAVKRCDAEWQRPRARKDQLVLATILRLEGMLRTFQRRFNDALALIGRSRKLFRAAADPSGEAKALIQLATIHTFGGHPKKAIGPLGKAAELLQDHHDPFLAFVVSLNQANALVRIRQLRAASETLLDAETRYEHLDYPFGEFELKALGGFIQHGMGHEEAAEGLYLEARSGFVEAGDGYRVALTSLDLAILYSNMDRWSEVLKEASQATQLLEPLNLHAETLQGVKLLAGAVKAGQVSIELLRDLRERLERDPLSRLGQIAGAGDDPGPS